MRAILSRNLNILNTLLKTDSTTRRRLQFTNNNRFSEINYAINNLNIPTITIVRNKDQAKLVLKILKSHRDRFHAWDTETTEINLKEQSPVLFGKIICMSCFIGPDIDFGNGPSIELIRILSKFII